MTENDVGMRVQPFTETLLCKMVAKRSDPDGYVTYVFQDLTDGTYRMATRMPNWKLPHISIGDVGYMKYMEAVAGRDCWYDHENDVYVHYKYDGSYILDWILDTRNG